MSTLLRLLTILLFLLLSACAQPTAPSPTLTLSPSPAVPPTITPTPAPPSLESLGLTAEIQQMFTRQGWDIAWEYGRVGDSPQPARYTIRQRAWDEASQTFTPQKNREIGFIDTEGNLHTKVTRLSATENPDGTWKDTSTTQDLILPLRSPLPLGEGLGVRVIETKNPAFEKTGILTLTYLDENGIPQTVTYNRELNFLQIPELSTDLLHPTPISIEAVHSLAALQFILLRYGDGEPLPTDGFPGWSIRFEYDETTGTKRAFLFLDAPISNDANATRKFIRFVGEGDNGKVLFPLPKFVIIDKNGKGFVAIPVEISNPKDPQNPKDGNEKLILFPALFTGTMTPSQRIEFLKSFPYDENIINELFGRQRLIIIATQPGSNGDGYFTVLYKTNGGGWNKVGDRRPLDSLLGMEGNDVKTQLWEQSNGGYANISGNLGYLEQLNEQNKLLETAAMRYMLPPALQKLILPLSP